jgi:hypothetical protein
LPCLFGIGLAGLRAGGARGALSGTAALLRAGGTAMTIGVVPATALENLARTTAAMAFRRR